MKRIIQIIKKFLGWVLPEIDERSMAYLGRTYKRSPSMVLYVNDRVNIHPVPGHSEATNVYPGKIVIKNISWVTKNGTKKLPTLYVKGISENKNWPGFVLNNDYGFNRLEFVERNYKE